MLSFTPVCAIVAHICFAHLTTHLLHVINALQCVFHPCSLYHTFPRHRCTLHILAPWPWNSHHPTKVNIAVRYSEAEEVYCCVVFQSITSLLLMTGPCHDSSRVLGYNGASPRVCALSASDGQWHLWAADHPQFCWQRISPAVYWGHLHLGDAAGAVGRNQFMSGRRYAGASSCRAVVTRARMDMR